MKIAADLFELHRDLVAIPSISHKERGVADFVESWFCNLEVPTGLEFKCERIEENILVRAKRGRGPRLLFCSHYDTVPANEKWTRDPWQVENIDGRIYGLGSNDAKASVSAMMTACQDFVESDVAGELILLLAADEETGGRGTEIVCPHLLERGWLPDGVVVGEPTGLDIASAQKGLMILELLAKGDAVHAANAMAMKAENAILTLSQDVLALESLRQKLARADADLGELSIQATMLNAGVVKNALPAQAEATLDLRTVPGDEHAEIIETLRAHLASEVIVRSERLKPVSCAQDAAVIRAAKSARPEARVYGSATMSDMVFFGDFDAIKVGPGQSERSHTADEYVLESELAAGYQFYRDLWQQFFSPQVS